jgi:hypothetical protein
MSVGDFDRKTVVINSQFRESGASNAFTWRFQERVESIRHAEVRYFILENGVYNVTEDNNTFYLSEGSVSGSWTRDNMEIVIPTGFYDDSTLTSTIGLCMTAASFGSGGANLYLVEQQSTGFLQFSCGINAGSTDFAISFFNGITSQLLTAQLLGFTETTIEYAYTSAGSGLFNTVISDLPTTLANFDYLLIQSQRLGNDISFYANGNAPAIGNQLVLPDARLRPSPTNCFAFIPNTSTSRNSSLIFNNQRPPQISTLKYPFTLDYIDIAIVDKLGNAVDLRGNNITLVIELYTDKRSQPVPSDASWDKRF